MRKLGPKARRKEAVTESMFVSLLWAGYGNRGRGQQKKADHGGGFCDVRDGLS